MLFFRQAGILKLRKKGGESSSKCFFVVFSLFPSPEFSCVRWVGKCLMKNRLSSSSSFLPSSSHYCKAMSLISIHAFNKSGRHLEFLIYDVIRGKISAAIFEF